MIFLKSCSVIFVIAIIVTCARASVEISTNTPKVSGKPTEHTTSVTSLKTTPAPSTIHPTTVAPSYDPLMTFNGSDGTTTCILLKGKFLFSVPYPKNDRKHGSVTVGVHDVMSTTGHCYCNGTNELIMVEFFKDWKMVIVFDADFMATLQNICQDDVDNGEDHSGSFWWQQLRLTYHYDDRFMPGLNASFNGRNNTVIKSFRNHAFKASVDGSYKCDTDTVIHLSDGAKLTISGMQYQAFQANTTGFPTSNVTKCSKPHEGHDSSDVVPIAVGASLAGLILIVVVAYCITRVRRKKNSYESM